MSSENKQVLETLTLISQCLEKTTLFIAQNWDILSKTIRNNHLHHLTRDEGEEVLVETTDQPAIPTALILYNSTTLEEVNSRQEQGNAENITFALEGLHETRANSELVIFNVREEIDPLQNSTALVRNDLETSIQRLNEIINEQGRNALEINTEGIRLLLEGHGNQQHLVVSNALEINAERTRLLLEGHGNQQHLVVSNALEINAERTRLLLEGHGNQQHLVVSNALEINAERTRLLLEGLENQQHRSALVLERLQEILLEHNSRPPVEDYVATTQTNAENVKFELEKLSKQLSIIAKTSEQSLERLFNLDNKVLALADQQHNFTTSVENNSKEVQANIKDIIFALEKHSTTLEEIQQQLSATNVQSKTSRYKDEPLETSYQPNFFSQTERKPGKPKDVEPVLLEPLSTTGETLLSTNRQSNERTNSTLTAILKEMKEQPSKLVEMLQEGKEKLPTNHPVETRSVPQEPTLNGTHSILARVQRLEGDLSTTNEQLARVSNLQTTLKDRDLATQELQNRCTILETKVNFLEKQNTVVDNNSNNIETGLRSLQMILSTFMPEGNRNTLWSRTTGFWKLWRQFWGQSQREKDAGPRRQKKMEQQKQSARQARREARRQAQQDIVGQARHEGLERGRRDGSLQGFQRGFQQGYRQGYRQGSYHYQQSGQIEHSGQADSHSRQAQHSQADSAHADSAHAVSAHADPGHADSAHADSAHADSAHADSGHGPRQAQPRTLAAHDASKTQLPETNIIEAFLIHNTFDIRNKKFSWIWPDGAQVAFMAGLSYLEKAPQSVAVKSLIEEGKLVLPDGATLDRSISPKMTMKCRRLFGLPIRPTIKAVSFCIQIEGAIFDMPSGLKTLLGDEEIKARGLVGTVRDTYCNSVSWASQNLPYPPSKSQKQGWDQCVPL